MVGSWPTHSININTNIVSTLMMFHSSLQNLQDRFDQVLYPVIDEEVLMWPNFNRHVLVLSLIP